MTKRDQLTTTGFTASDFFDVASPGRSPLLTVRPRTYLQNARFVGYLGPSGKFRSLSNRDHLVLEGLITAFGQSDPRSGRPLHSVPVKSILRLLPDGTVEKDLKASLDRLTLTLMALDRVRMGAFERQLVPLRSGCDQPIPEGAPADRDLSGRAPLPTRASRQASRDAEGRRYRMSQAARDYLAPAHFQTLLAVDPGRVTTPDDLQASDEPLTLRPLYRWVIVDGTLAFDLCPYLRFYLRRDRTRRMSDWDDGVRRIAWLHLDLGRMRKFRGAPTICLYRHLTDRIGWSKRPRTVELSMSFDEIADLTSLRLQKTGGLKGQVENAVLTAADRDFSETTGEFSVAMRWRDEKGAYLDRVHFTIETDLPDPRRLRSRRIVDEGRTEITSDDLLFIARPDVPGLRVGLGTWSKVNGLWKIRFADLVNLSTAFDIALDEMLHLEGRGGPEDGGVVAVSEGVTLRKFRAERLRAVIDREGIERACLRFCVEEMADPDLTAPETRLRLRLSMIEAHAREVRMERLAAYKRKREPREVELRAPRFDVRDAIDRHRAAVAEGEHQAALLRKDRALWKSIKDDVRRDDRNARRRARRAKEKLDAETAARSAAMEAAAIEDERKRVVRERLKIEEVFYQRDSEYLQPVDD